MEYENMRVPELKSLARNCGLRNLCLLRLAKVSKLLSFHCKVKNHEVIAW